MNTNLPQSNTQSKRPKQEVTGRSLGSSDTLPNGIRLKFTNEAFRELWLNKGEIQ